MYFAHDLAGYVCEKKKNKREERNNEKHQKVKKQNEKD